jgi:hypothetical protein
VPRVVLTAKSTRRTVTAVPARTERGKRLNRTHQCSPYRSPFRIPIKREGEERRGRGQNLADSIPITFLLRNNSTVEGALVETESDLPLGDHTVTVLDHILATGEDTVAIVRVLDPLDTAVTRESTTVDHHHREVKEAQ